MFAPRSDRGTVLMLMPAAVLVLFVLGAIAVDSAVAFMAQRNLASAAADASNNAGDVAVDQAAVLGRGQLTLDAQAAKTEVEKVLQSDGITDATIDAVRPTPDGHGFQVVVERKVHLPFAAPIPGAPHTTTVKATVTVTDVET
jgi:Flp pilus assembly protein TadG